MPYDTPPISQISERIRGHFEAELPGSNPRIWPNNLFVSAKVFAAAMFDGYQAIRYALDQAFVTSATGEFLERHGAEIAINRLAATYSTGKVTIDGPQGTIIPAAAQFTRADGVIYESTLTTQTIGSSGSIDIDVQAVEAGANGNGIASTALGLGTTINGITSVVVHIDGIGGGADVENDFSLRERILFRMQNRPHGGSPPEYIDWSRELAGVTRVWVERAYNGPGTVGIFFMMDDAYADGIPQQIDVQALTSYLGTQAPAPAALTVYAPIAVPMNVTISNLLPSTMDVQNAVEVELADMIRRRASPGVDFKWSWIWEAVSNAVGEDSHTVQVPSSNVAVAPTEIATLGTVTFV
ncbi:MAG: baseplate J/gp47 family protein [Hyphomicrobiales bacterium]